MLFVAFLARKEAADDAALFRPTWVPDLAGRAQTA
jgi:hypothetical protein